MTDSRTQFISAGLALYPELGYHKLSVRALAAQAKLSAGMFHHLFENKDDFMRQLFEQYFQNISMYLQDEVLAQQISPDKQLRQVLLFWRKRCVKIVCGYDVCLRIAKTMSAWCMSFYWRIRKTILRLWNTYCAAACRNAMSRKFCCVSII